MQLKNVAKILYILVCKMVFLSSTDLYQLCTYITYVNISGIISIERNSVDHYIIKLLNFVNVYTCTVESLKFVGANFHGLLKFISSHVF